MEIKINGKNHKLNKDYQSLLQALQGEEIWLKAPCGGLGVCGKCQVTIETPTHTSESDLKTLSKKALASGVRLACTYPLQEGLSVQIESSDMAIESNILIDYEVDASISYKKIDPKVLKTKNTTSYQKAFDLDSISLSNLHEMDQYLKETTPFYVVEGFGQVLAIEGKEPRLYGCAIDIGTTTVVMTFMDLKSGKIVSTESFENPQRAYGADVITRITYGSSDAGLTKLHKMIVESMTKALTAFQRDFGAVYHMVVSGNTTMCHLLLNLQVKSLGAHPFHYWLDEVYHLDMSHLFENSKGILTLIPPISTFVGGDLTAGALSLNIHKKEGWHLLIDLGTNGELILGNEKEIFGTATAAGPVFEGVSLSCGMPAIGGALYDVTDTYETIGDLPMTGICGTGAISLLHWLYKEDYIDSTGRLDEDFQADNKFPIKGDIHLSQEDIRALQTAKSAIRTGVDILFDKASIKADDLQGVYIAGGFGNKLNLDAFCGIGMLPETLKYRTQMIGNASLSGAVKCLLNKASFEELKVLKANAVGIQLNDHPDFQDLYMKYMYL